MNDRIGSARGFIAIVQGAVAELLAVSTWRSTPLVAIQRVDSFRSAQWISDVSEAFVKTLIESINVILAHSLKNLNAMIHESMVKMFINIYNVVRCGGVNPIITIVVIERKERTELCFSLPTSVKHTFR